ncbi:hypothetical protein L1987_57397 [Smallanthus sonchifolius]|uniref:Uncharacterized protein n=1 Tax=Smallanthus sonchifolius TaxID=185202 RepID=A0ACB9DD62_9ASTR|nr:hypothetical protein L1987_57397 [Smallanthus sonchifolius]
MKLTGSLSLTHGSGKDIWIQLLIGKADSLECVKRMLESVDVEGDTIRLEKNMDLARLGIVSLRIRNVMPYNEAFKFKLINGLAFLMGVISKLRWMKAGYKNKYASPFADLLAFRNDGLFM